MSVSSSARTDHRVPVWQRASGGARRSVARAIVDLVSYAPPYSDLLPGHDVRLLVDGAEAFPRMLRAIERAREYVHLETYIWAHDHIGTQFAELLRKKARAGVRVRVIYDGFGSSLPWNFVQELKDDHIEILEYRPLTASLTRDKLKRLSRRDHRKLLVVDGRISFCGGINLGDEYSSVERGGSGWRDTHVEIEGPVTQQLDTLFHDNWHAQGGRSYRLKRVNPRDYSGSSLAAALPSDESGQRTTIRRHYLHAINRARRFIYIANAYFVPSKSFLRTLVRAAARGVEVRLLLPTYQYNDVFLVQLASQHTYRELLRGGVKIHQWPVSHMHAKCAVIDGAWSVVGSYNLDAVSLFQNLEVVVEIIGEEFGRNMKAMFEHDFDRSIELDYDQWRRRGATHRLIEGLLYRYRRFL